MNTYTNSARCHSEITWNRSALNEPIPEPAPREDTKQLEEELGIAILELPEGYDHFEPVYFGITDDTESGFYFI